MTVLCRIKWSTLLQFVSLKLPASILLLPVVLVFHALFFPTWSSGSMPGGIVTLAQRHSADFLWHLAVVGAGGQYGWFSSPSD